MAQNKDEEVYSMEKILDKRISSSGKLEYLIAWENFGPEDNTWEPQSNIFCPVMLKNFEERKAAEKRSVYVFTEQGVSSKPSGTPIVAPNLCFLS